MSENIVMFADCDSAQLKKCAKEVLLGGRRIAILVGAPSVKFYYAVEPRDNFLGRSKKNDPWREYETDFGLAKDRDGRDCARIWPSAVKLYKTSLQLTLIDCGHRLGAGFWLIMHFRNVAADILEGKETFNLGGPRERHKGKCLLIVGGKIKQVVSFSNVVGEDRDVYLKPDFICDFSLAFCSPSLKSPLDQDRAAIQEGIRIKVSTNSDSVKTGSTGPIGGDRLTEKLYDFANECGRENVAAKGFKDWLRKNYPDFDVTHGSISFRHGNGKFAEVNSDRLRARIYRMKHSPKAR